MGWWLRLTANILAFLRLTVNFFPLRLTDVFKINFYCCYHILRSYDHSGIL